MDHLSCLPFPGPHAPPSCSFPPPRDPAVTPALVTPRHLHAKGPRAPKSRCQGLVEEREGARGGDFLIEREHKHCGVGEGEGVGVKDRTIPGSRDCKVFYLMRGCLIPCITLISELVRERQSVGQGLDFVVRGSFPQGLTGGPGGLVLLAEPLGP